MKLRRSWPALLLSLRARRYSPLVLLMSEHAPVDLRLVGRTLLHAVLIGAIAGLVGAAFFLALELSQRFLLEGLAGYKPLRAAGEAFAAAGEHGPFRPWLLAVLPALGGLIAGLVTELAPEARGGGTDATIQAFHHRRGIVRLRAIWVKALASIATLSFGGAGGREGPTMQIGGGIGSLVGRLLGVSARERRILLIAGVAAGMAAVFRTPLGAALLAIEVLYRDGFESESLVPAVLASVVAYAVVISMFGESTLFAHAPRYPFVYRHLPLYALMALLVAALGSVFVRALQAVRRASARLPGPAWLRPAAGGLAVGVLFAPVIAVVGAHLSAPGRGLGILGGSYGGVQLAITGAEWLPDGWFGVELLLLLALAKLVAAALTIGSGGSAGDFAPSLIIGGLAGGAFGRAAQLLSNDPFLDPGAFALVGMGAFYGGIGHVPLSSLILVCELAGSYDLLVPLMLAEGVAFVALRRQSLYEAQLPTYRDSPAHEATDDLERLEHAQVRDLMRHEPPFVTFSPATTTAAMLQHETHNSWQEVFPVLGPGGRLEGLISLDVLHLLAIEREASPFTIAADLMEPPVQVRPSDTLRTAAELLVAHNLRELPVFDDAVSLVGFIDEADITRAYLRRAVPLENERIV